MGYLLLVLIDEWVVVGGVCVNNKIWIFLVWVNIVYSWYKKIICINNILFRYYIKFYFYLYDL